MSPPGCVRSVAVMASGSGSSGSGELQRGFAAAEDALAARDDALADADRRLTDAVVGAYRIATESIRRIEGIQAEIDATGAGPEAGECARLLIERNRDLIDAVRSASSAARAKTVELQRLSENYCA